MYKHNFNNKSFEVENPLSEKGLSKRYRTKCPYCGRFHTTMTQINIKCTCGARYYPNLGRWFKGDKTHKNDWWR